ncbi:OmpP1/FadL family transporter [Spectribacter hydrogenooxidans]|uniref:Outer membrane protein transport protein n=1 Tax=Spectribacter hydrogenoxidans TaxID=3075608 RepID=A0ABU3C1R6_9GAMM|nr:outer membrane protein transport protein [Salinisphaera sp. W335]MDT0635485.1 outer membrane protein transport protein [Salinisphaera sp. W335]
MLIMNRAGTVLTAAMIVLGVAMPARAGGGYFILGYGPYANQSAGTATAVGMDAFAAASNPAKLSAVEDRVDLGLILFMPYRRVERTGSGTPYDFASTSDNDLFLLPEAGIAKRINDRWSWGVALYGNGGLNTEYHGNTGIPDTNANPGRCGSQPGNFFLGCGKVGFDLAQVNLAPTLSWQATPKHSFGATLLLTYQRFEAYGLEAFESVSQNPQALTGNGHDEALGAGIRIGWYGEITPWLDAGAAWSSRVYMQDFDDYEGLLADGGNFDLPENYNVGVAIKPDSRWTIGLDIQRIRYSDIPALDNGVLNSLNDPQGSPLGSGNGSAFNWASNTIYKAAVAFDATDTLTLRGGYAYGDQTQRDDGPNSVSLNMFTPNAIHQVSLGLSWRLRANNELNFAYSRYTEVEYDGPSATAGLGVGGTEKLTARVDQVMLAWSWFP